jgi:hypothetical protein
VSQTLKRPRVRPCKYKAYLYGPSGYIQDRITIEALTDADAIASAKRIDRAGPVELWLHRQFIARFDTVGATAR